MCVVTSPDAKAWSGYVSMDRPLRLNVIRLCVKHWCQALIDNSVDHNHNSAGGMAFF